MLLSIGPLYKFQLTVLVIHLSESDWYTASVNNDCYAEAWGVSKERVHWLKSREKNL